MMTITRLTGGLTPADGSDPRTFPAIWNDAVDDIEQAEADVAALEALNPVAFGTATPVNGSVLVYGTATSEYVPTATAGYVYAGQVRFTSDGTFSKADPFGTGDIGLRAVRVRVQGAGGGGAGVTNAEAGAGAGGGAGAYAEGFITDIAGLSSSVSVDVGLGGSGSATNVTASVGGTSSFGALLVASGGRGGGTNGLPAVPATFSGTNVQIGIQGGPGASGGFMLHYPGGIGASSPLGSGGSGARATGGAAASNAGGNASLYGAGGGGACHATPDLNDRSGGNGSDGIVIVDCFV